MSGSRTVAVDVRSLVGRLSGIGFFTRALLQALAERGAFDYVGMAHRATRAEEELRAAGIRLESQAAPLGTLWQQFVLPRRLSQGDIDIFWSPLITLPRRLPIPGVVTIHDLTPVVYPESHRLKIRLSILPFLHATIDNARWIAVDSEATASDIRTYFPQAARRLRVVYPGVDGEFAPAPADKIATVREALGCPQGYLLYAGTLEPRKNLDVLLDAWQGLREEGAAPPLVLAGGYGWHSRQLVRRIERLEPLGLRHLGRLHRRRLIEVFQAASVFAYPSLYEGFGLPPAEAMACGIPTVASRSASLPEVVGDAGMLIDPTDAYDLARALRRLFDDTGLRRELAERGIRRAARFQWSAAAASMEELFADALSDG